jgi:Leu/Phe-tRNA-protein transferase
MPPESIYPLRESDLLDPERLRLIYEYPGALYWSQDWSPEFYLLQAKAGFIATSFFHPQLGSVLLPEIQTNYAVLDWKNRHCERSMKRWQRSARFRDQNYRLEHQHDFEAILKGIQDTHGKGNWLRGPYVELLRLLRQHKADPDFRLTTTGLLARDGELVAGEIGYEISRTYTSLTGFCRRDHPDDRHVGKLQLHWLAESLEARGFAFWNLGHPHMAYKEQLGARILPRKEFLARWPDLSLENHRHPGE